MYKRMHRKNVPKAIDWQMGLNTSFLYKLQSAESEVLEVSAMAKLTLGSALTGKAGQRPSSRVV